MNDLNFLSQLADLVAERVTAKVLASLQEKDSGPLSGLLDNYGPVMNRDEVAKVLRLSTRQIQNMEKAGRIRRLAVSGKQIKYATAQVAKMMK